MASGINELAQLWRELLERTRRTQSRTAQRRLTVIRTEDNPVDMFEVLEVLDPGATPTTATWGDNAGWGAANDFSWSDGSKWR